MNFQEFVQLTEDDYDDICQVVYVDEENKIIMTEAEFFAIELMNDEDFEQMLSESCEILQEYLQQYKRVGMKLKRQFRCTSGPKAGKIVSSPTECSKRKNPKKIRAGKRTARIKKGVRAMKTKISKRKYVSKLVTKMNRRLSGKPTVQSDG